ncbi:hypothetical protein [Kitasatospora sp. NPDC007106]|uniref:hypothetical protein n=1 Tax=Kitasatospora sp. NPDC007106 TaxID=3156914 RepID=UPI0033CF449F
MPGRPGDGITDTDPQEAGHTSTAQPPDGRKDILLAQLSNRPSRSIARTPRLPGFKERAA